LPSPELPYIYSGLKGVWPGSTPTATPAACAGADAINSRDIVQIRAAFLGKLTLKW